jgi:MFS family permease
MGNEAFAAWGWRIPFLLSALLLGISLWIRLKLNESPVFQQMVKEGKSSRSPIKDSFGNRKNLKLVLLALFGLTAGQAVVWYCGQFYALFFLERVLKVDPVLTNQLIAVALLLGTPMFVLFGWLSDKIGRKPIIMAGCLLAALTLFPLFKALTVAANPALAAAAERAPITVVAAPGDCSFQFDPVGRAQFLSSCDIAKGWLARAGLPYENQQAAPGAVSEVRIGGNILASFDGRAVERSELAARRTAWEKQAASFATAAGYPAASDSEAVDKPMVVGILLVLMIYVGMVYGPIAAMLVEMFPANIRYTSMSLPYHIGNGWFGGFLPTTAFAMVAATGNIYYGLWYPVVVAGATFVIGSLFVRETRHAKIEA